MLRGKLRTQFCALTSGWVRESSDPGRYKYMRIRKKFLVVAPAGIVPSRLERPALGSGAGLRAKPRIVRVLPSRIAARSDSAAPRRSIPGFVGSAFSMVAPAGIEPARAVRPEGF